MAADSAGDNATPPQSMPVEATGTTTKKERVRYHLMTLATVDGATRTAGVATAETISLQGEETIATRLTEEVLHRSDRAPLPKGTDGAGLVREVHSMAESHHLRGHTTLMRVAEMTTRLATGKGKRTPSALKKGPKM